MNDFFCIFFQVSHHPVIINLAFCKDKKIMSSNLEITPVQRYRGLLVKVYTRKCQFAIVALSLIGHIAICYPQKCVNASLLMVMGINVTTHENDFLGPRG